MIFQIYQVVRSTPPERKIYFKNNVIDTLQFQKDLKLFNELNKRNYDSLLIEGKNLLEQSELLEFRWGLFISNFEISYAYLKLGNLDSALHYANKTMLIAKDGAPEWLANSHKRLGTCYEAMDDFEKAIYHYIECEKIARANNLDELVIDILNSKGILYRKMDDYKTALQHFTSILKEYPNSLTAFDRFRVENNIANVYYDQGLFDRALESFNKAREYAMATGDSIHISRINQNLGNIFFRKNQFDKAESYILESIRYFEKSNEKATLESLFRTMGSIQTRKRNFAEAERYFIMSMKLAKQINNIRVIALNYHNLAVNFKKWRIQEPFNNKLLKRENTCLHAEIAYKDSLHDIESTEKIHELEKKYETEKKNNQIALLEKETEVQKNRQMFLYIGMGILVMIMGILVVSFQYVKKTNNTLLIKNQRIELQKKQIQLQNNQLEVSINTQNKLFSIIAHDLRSPLASISNIGILLKTAFEQKNIDLAKELVQKLEQRNDQVLQLTDNLLSWASTQTDKIIFTPEKCSLNDILHESASVFEGNIAQKDINFKIEPSNDTDIFVDDITIKTVFRNLINNAIKYTWKGGNVTISHFVENKKAIVKISDTGIGISQYIQNIIFEVTDKKQQPGTQGEKSSGLGLVVCKEFVERNNGRIWFTSIEGKGSDFYVALPLFKNNTNSEA